MNTTSTRLRQLADRMGLDGFAEELREIAGELEAQAAPAEPFGYFRAEPMGWTDCAATDEGAIALYERPAAPAVPQGWQISERKIDGQDAVIINGPMGGCVAYKDSDIPRVLPESILYELATAMLASTPSQPVTEQETLVGLSIHGKELRNENIVYDGGPLYLTDCKLLSCHIEFSKAAARTVQFLAIAEQSQPGFLQPLFADAVRLTKPSQPVTLTDEQALKDAFEEGYCARSTYNDVDLSDIETEWAKSSAKASIAALREKQGGV